MSLVFTDEDFERIGRALAAEPQRDNSSVRYSLEDKESGRAISVEIHPSLKIPKAAEDRGPNNLVTVEVGGSKMQLQGCTSYLESEDLGEVIFFAERKEVTSGLVLERQAACSLYANFDNNLRTADYTRLSPELVMGALTLSLTSDLLSDLP